MSLYDIIQNILDVSKNHNLVREVGEGDIYNYLNSSEHQYPCVFLTVSSINDDLNLRNVNCTLFYVDRLTSDESNKILVQSLGLSVLSDIIERIAGDVDTVEYTTFTEKFTDLCGGVYASLSIGYPLDGACSNDFEIRELEVTENGVYDVLGYDRIVVTTSPKFVVPDGMKFSQSKLSKFPESLDFSEVTDFSRMFESCNYIKELPSIDTSSGVNFSRMFYDCGRLERLHHIDTSSGVNFSQMFYDCGHLIEPPMLETSSGVNFSQMFQYAGPHPDFAPEGYESVKIPEYDYSSGENFSNMFYFSSYTGVPKMNTKNGKNFQRMFWQSEIREVEEIDVSNATNIYEAFEFSKITSIRFKGSINQSITFSHSRPDYESIKSILTACSNTTNPTTSKTFSVLDVPLTDQNSELAELVAICNTKGWTISGLILQ